MLSFKSIIIYGTKKNSQSTRTICLRKWGVQNISSIIIFAMHFIKKLLLNQHTCIRSDEAKVVYQVNL